MHLLLSFLVIIGCLSFLFTPQGDDVYFLNQIVLKPEVGLVYDWASTLNKNLASIVESFAIILHMAFIGSDILLFFMLIIVIFFPVEEKRYLFGKDGVKLNDAFDYFFKIQLAWIVYFFTFENAYLDFIHILLLMTLYYSVHPVLKMNEVPPGGEK